MHTIKLFQDDVYLKTVNVIVTEINKNENKIDLVLDKTIFFPTGGGQSCDIGSIDKYHVVDVYEDEENLIHHTILEPACDILLNSEVEIKIDWNLRFENMQRHCGEHILSGIFHREYGGINRGFHMGDDYMTIDISLEDNPNYTEINWDMCLNAESCANEIIWKNEPIKVLRFNSYEQAKDFPVRKPLELDENISIVCIGSLENPSDSVACCGTHPATAGQVGFIKLYKVESNKGMYRIYFDAGKKALLEYDKSYDALTKLTNYFSAGINDVMDKIKAREEKNKSVRDRAYKLAKHVASLEESKIRKSLSDEPASFKFDILTIDELLGIGRNLSETLTSVLFLVHNPTNTVLLFSNGKPDCGELVKDNANIYGGKGGGRKESARAIFPKEEYIDVFIDLIEKHLR